MYQYDKNIQQKVPFSQLNQIKCFLILHTKHYKILQVISHNKHI